jgi:hypothetical protein
MFPDSGTEETPSADPEAGKMIECSLRQGCRLQPLLLSNSSGLMPTLSRSLYLASFRGLETLASSIQQGGWSRSLEASRLYFSQAAVSV